MNDDMALQLPTHCDSCCSVNIQFTTNDHIYGELVGEWPFIWLCGDCECAVGCHSQTKQPLGRMADWETRKLRSRAHKAFDCLWETHLMARSKAYDWLALQLGVSVDAAHISWLSKDQLRDVISLSTDYLTQYQRALVRRKGKRNGKQSERLERERAIQQRKVERDNKFKRNRRSR